MADRTSTETGGDAPRTLFSLGRSSKRKGRGTKPSALEEYPPQHADIDAVADDVATNGSADGPQHAVSTDEAAPAHAETVPTDCPSCGEPLVPGAAFCGECGTRVVAAEGAVPAAVLLDDVVPGEPLPPAPDGSCGSGQCAGTTAPGW